ncbi:ClpX C4-type zinc finger protein [Nonomuraea fastidiosa]|uniref:ClpX C4-type zinc finger protein n=1 Tax=Nonomuraea fastidiosa TaxID=46173 RepID=UPI0036719DFB
MTRSRRTRPAGPADGMPTRCSFCGEPYAEAVRVVAGPGVYICDVCVDLAAQIIASSPPGSGDAPRPVHRGPDPRTDAYLAGMSDDDMPAVLPRQALTVEQAERDLRACAAAARARGDVGQDRDGARRVTAGRVGPVRGRRRRVRRGPHRLIQYGG